MLRVALQRFCGTIFRLGEQKSLPSPGLTWFQIRNDLNRFSCGKKSGVNGYLGLLKERVFPLIGNGSGAKMQALNVPQRGQRVEVVRCRWQKPKGIHGANL